MRWLFIVIALIGCATPYQRNGLRGGYTDYEVKGQPGVHFVSFVGNFFTDEVVVYDYWRQRVIELCAGKRFETLSSGDKKAIVPIRRPRVQGYIRCSAQDAASPAAGPR